MLFKILCAFAGLFGLLASPEFVATLLTSDNELGHLNYARIQALRATSLALAAIALFLQYEYAPGQQPLFHTLAQIQRGLKSNSDLLIHSALVLIFITLGTFYIFNAIALGGKAEWRGISQYR